MTATATYGELVDVNGIIFEVHHYNSTEFVALIKKINRFNTHKCTRRFILMTDQIQGENEQMQYLLDSVVAKIINLKDELLEVNECWELVDKEALNPKNEYDIYDYIQNVRNICDQLNNAIWNE
jgi:hypothetical protein